MTPPRRDRDVLTSLPRHRSAFRSAKRPEQPSIDGHDEAAPGTAAEGPAAPERKPAAAKAKPKPAAGAKPAAAKAKPAAAGAKPAAAKAKPAAARAAGAKARPAAAPGARAKAAAEAAPAGASRPTPPAAGWATPHEHKAPQGAGEIVGTAVQAVGELAQIGLTFGGQAVKQALSRLPRP